MYEASQEGDSLALAGWPATVTLAWNLTFLALTCCCACSGASDLPMPAGAGLVPFAAPDSLAVELHLPHR
jgi:hypothetical protein